MNDENPFMKEYNEDVEGAVRRGIERATKATGDTERNTEEPEVEDYLGEHLNVIEEDLAVLRKAHDDFETIEDLVSADQIRSFQEHEHYIVQLLYRK